MSEERITQLNENTDADTAKNVHPSETPGAAEHTANVKRVLIYATTAYMIDRFNMMNIRLLQEMGYEVDAACNFESGNALSKERLRAFQEELDVMHVRRFQLPLTRNILDIRHNGAALRKSIRIMRENRYAFVHCHTPVGSVIARMAARATGTKIIYTAHGFHFFDGAPKLNWLLYYPIEKFFSGMTDVLITINREDYERAKAKFHMKRLEYVPGVGIDLGKFRQGTVVTIDSLEAANAAGADLYTDAANAGLPEEMADRSKLASAGIRKELGIGEDTFLMVSVGELSKRKNHIAALQALNEIEEEKAEGKQIPDYHYAIVGTSIGENTLQQYINEHGLQQKVTLLGFRTDVEDICRASDAFLFPSKQEGLPAALMEAMACGLPAAVSRIRGNADLIDEEGGFLFDLDAASIKEAILCLLSTTPKERRAMGEHNAAKIRSGFSTEAVRKRLEEIYGNI